MPFGLGIAAIGGFVLKYAPDVISVVGRLLAGRPGAEKKAVAAKELFEVVSEALDQDWSLDEIGELNTRKLFRAMEDETEFVARLAAVNDAIYEFSKYVNDQEVYENNQEV